MNKTDLINQLAERLDGDKKAAQAAVEGFIDLVQREVQKGRNVSISGFGVFEKRARAARTARNPRTGEAVKVKKTTVPAFRPGKYFKDVIAGSVKLPKPTGKPTSARAAAAAAKAGPTTAAKATTTRAPRAAAAARRPPRPPVPVPPPNPLQQRQPRPGPGPPRRPRLPLRQRRPLPGRPGRPLPRPPRLPRLHRRPPRQSRPPAGLRPRRSSRTASGFKVRWVALERPTGSASVSAAARTPMSWRRPLRP